MNYSIRPDKHELREAREISEKILESCKYVIEKNEEFSINLGYASIGEFGVSGSATANELQVFFDADTEGWKENFEDLVADVYGKSWFYENSEVNFKWQQLTASVTGLMIIEEISEKREIEVEEFRQEWADKKTSLSDSISKGEENFSWQLKTAIGRELLDRYDLEDFSGLKRNDVLEAGDALFE